MSLPETTLAALAATLDDAARNAVAIPQISETTALDLDDAYRVQALSVARRLDRGDVRVGMKMGFTSRAKMKQMNVHSMIWGRLTRAMIAEEGGILERARFVHPRVEPEVAFLMKRRLAGRVTAAEALAAVEAVAPALEIIDSRYRDFRFSLPDVVADNSSSSAFVVGPARSPRDISNLGLVLSVDGAPVEIGSTAAILGAPVRSLVAAAAMVAAAGEALEPGSVVMAGGATAAQALAPGMVVTLEMQDLGRISFEVR